MSFNIIPTPTFEREAKRLSKKHRSLKTDLATLVTSLRTNPLLGTSIGSNCFKIRLAITSKGKGKSGGARIITYVKSANETMYLLSIYDKAESETITNEELLRRIENLSI